MAKVTIQQRVGITILVAALGYFVDVFDLQLFSMLRVSSLKALGLTPDQITTVGAQLLNWQMAGMLTGGLLWGVLGDRKGRVYVLFGTILLYSVSNIANAFVATVPQYAMARFFTGLGLAGEIGAGVTLATELLPKYTRVYATAAIVRCGVMGPVVASFMADAIDWRLAYIGGGVLGMLLLTLRITVNDSGLFRALGKHHGVVRGNFFMLLSGRKRFVKYASCILSAVPNWFVVGILAIFAPEIGAALDMHEPLKASTAVVSCYIGLTLGGSLSGILSQILRSRRAVMLIFMMGSAITSFIILNTHDIPSSWFYGLMLLDGLFVGYWTLFMTTTAEQFGTNLRATAATTAPNFVRASLILNTLIITNLKPSYGLAGSVSIDGAICFIVALLALWKLPETFGADVDFVER